MNRIVQDLSLCKRANKIVMGFDVVKQSLDNGSAYILLVAKDLSAKSLKEVNFLSDKYDVKCIGVDITLDELWYILGKRVGVLSITDEGLSKKIIADINAIQS